MTHVTYKTELADAQGFIALRAAADWGSISIETAQAALSSSLGGICAFESGELIGMARYIGDGTLNIYIQDVVIAPHMRAQSVGKGLLSHLIAQLQADYPATCTIGLMAARGQDGFYVPFGFIPRPSDVYGAGMTASLGDLKALAG